MATSTTLKAFLTVIEFAEQLGVDKTVIYRLRNERKIKVVNVGSLKRVRLRVAADQLEAAKQTLAAN